MSDVTKDGKLVDIGDIVWLASGGPPMSITRIFQSSGAPAADCCWFDQSGFAHKHGQFPLKCLLSIPPKENSQNE